MTRIEREKVSMSVKQILTARALSATSVIAVVVLRGRRPGRGLLALFALATALAMPESGGAENRLLTAALESITAEETLAHVDVLAADSLEGRAAGSRGGQAAARYIETRLGTLGIAPAGEGGRFTQPFYGAYR